MQAVIIYIIIGLVALAIGIIAGKIIFARDTKKQIEEAEEQSKRIISEGQLQAETLKKEKLLEAKERFVQLKSEHEREVMQRNQKITEAEGRVRQKEQSLNQKDQSL